MTEEEIDQVVIFRMIEVLNRAIKADRQAITKLLLKRVVCNETLARDSTVQVLKETSKPGPCTNIAGLQIGPKDVYSISPIGLLCALTGVDSKGWAKVAFVFETVCPDHGVQDRTAGQKCPTKGCLKNVELGLVQAVQGFSRPGAL